MKRKRYKRRREVARAADLVAELLDRRHVAADVRAHRIVVEWRAIVGERVAARTWPDGLKDGVLWVRVSNSAWLHELSCMREQLVVRLNEILGDPPLVTELRLHLGKRRRVDADDVIAMARQAKYRRPKTRRRPLPPPATGPRLAAIEREAACVEDDELRAIIVEARRRLDL